MIFLRAYELKENLRLVANGVLWEDEVMKHSIGRGDAFSIAVILLSLGIFLFFAGIFEYAEFGALVWASAFFSLLIWLVALGFWMVFTPVSRKTYGVCFAVGLSSLVFLLVNMWAILGVVLLIFFLFWALSSSKLELALLNEVRFFRIFQRTLSKAVWGLTILLAITYGVSIAELLEERGEIIPQPVIQTLVPDLSVGEFQDTLNDTVLRVFQGEVVLVDGTAAEESLAQFLHGAINGRLRDIIHPWQGVTPLFLVFGAFLILRILSIPFLWTALGLSWLGAYYLFASGRIEIKKKKAARETLVWGSQKNAKPV